MSFSGRVAVRRDPLKFLLPRQQQSPASLSRPASFGPAPHFEAVEGINRRELRTLMSPVSGSPQGGITGDPALLSRCLAPLTLGEILFSFFFFF